MQIREVENGIILEGIEDFEPAHVFDCGQCFRWIRQEDGSYTGVAMNRVINVNKEGDSIHIDNTNLEDFENIWYEYFDLARDYGVLKKDLAKHDENLKKAVEFGPGIRILKQDGWEMLISFIISSIGAP